VVSHEGRNPADRSQLLGTGLREQMSTAEVAAISAADKQFYELMLVPGRSCWPATSRLCRMAIPQRSLHPNRRRDALKGFLKLDPASFGSPATWADPAAGPSPGGAPGWIVAQWQQQHTDPEVVP
jgi:hypothetical protein